MPGAPLVPPVQNGTKVSSPVHTSGGFKGAIGTRVPVHLVQILLFSCSFRQQFCKRIGLARTLPLGSAHNSLGNPGSATTHK